MKIKSVFLTLSVPPILGNNPKESPVSNFIIKARAFGPDFHAGSKGATL